MSIQRCGWVITETGTFDVPEFLLDEEEILWPMGMPQVNPGQRTPLFSGENFYRRHEVVEGLRYVFLKSPRTLADISPQVLERFVSASSNGFD